ncbi:Na+/H+ antiporter subunit E [Sorangium sp. So ce362]|uniref:Na+/H+ antiporter subunit E n=1 Tax=Sorangium sp. So ce362 TaxID=3133303 RepID=UPI003F6379F2
MEEEGPARTKMIHEVRERLAQGGWRSVSVRTLVLIGGWWALTEGDRAGLAFGVPMVLLALFTSVCLPSPRAPRWSPLGLLRFMRFFLAGSLRGGLDVAHRALAPRLPISPVIIRFAPRLPAGPGRHLFIGAMNVMPGTLSVDIEVDHLDIHVLVDGGDELVRQLRALEEHIARALGERLECSRA